MRPLANRLTNAESVDAELRVRYGLRLAMVWEAAVAAPRVQAPNPCMPNWVRSLPKCS